MMVIDRRFKCLFAPLYLPSRWDILCRRISGNLSRYDGLYLVQLVCSTTLRPCAGEYNAYECRFESEHSP